MKKCHMQTMHETIGYLWTFILQSSDNALLSDKQYFNAIDWYMCCECGFIHTKEQDVRQHCAFIHCTKNINIKRGVTGIFIEAFFARKKLYKRIFFKLQHTARANAYMYRLSRGYMDAKAQTEYITLHVELKISGIINGCTEEICTHMHIG